MTDFRKNVLQIVRKIPKGTTLSYGEVARRAGKRQAARAVGAIMKANHDPQIPCHRVIRSDGKSGGFNRGIQEKIRLLGAEGASLATETHLKPSATKPVPKTQRSRKHPLPL